MTEELKTFMDVFKDLKLQRQEWHHSAALYWKALQVSCQGQQIATSEKSAKIVVH